MKKIIHLHGYRVNMFVGRRYPKHTFIWSEFGPLLELLVKRPLTIIRSDWRPGDQRVFVADISKAQELRNWNPAISPQEGIIALYNWVAGNPHLFV